MSGFKSGFRVVLGVALLVAGASAFAAESAKPTPQPYIPFANHGGIRDWAADHDRGVWLQDIHRRWYYAKLMGPCIGLDFATTIGFDTHPLGRFDQFSSIVVPGTGRCAVQTFSASGAPPSKKSGAKS